MTYARARQIDAVLLSEHEETGWTPEKYAEYVAACRNASTDEVQLIPGIEFSQDGFHVLCYGLQSFPARPSRAAQLAAAVREQGCWLCLAHPGKYRWRYPAGLLTVVEAVEVWNSKWIYDGEFGPHPASLRLAKEKRYFVGQDVHKVKHFSPLYLETASSAIMPDLVAGRYAIVFAGNRLTAAQLEANVFRQGLQAVRTAALKTALILYRLARGKHPFPHRNAVRKLHVQETV